MVHSLEPRFGWHSRGYLPHFDSFVRNQKIGPLAVLGFELDHCITAAAARNMRANRPQDAGAPTRAYGKFERGCSVILLITTLSDGRSVPCCVGAVIMISAFLMPSITRPNTVYFLSNAAWRFRVINH